MFDEGNSASYARHDYEQCLLLNATTDDTKRLSLADRAINALVQCVLGFFSSEENRGWKWKHEIEDGVPLFSNCKMK